MAILKAAPRDGREPRAPRRGAARDGRARRGRPHRGAGARARRGRRGAAAASSRVCGVQEQSLDAALAAIAPARRRPRSRGASSRARPTYLEPILAADPRPRPARSRSCAEVLEAEGNRPALAKAAALALGEAARRGDPPGASALPARAGGRPSASSRRRIPHIGTRSCLRRRLRRLRPRRARVPGARRSILEDSGAVHAPRARRVVESRSETRPPAPPRRRRRAAGFSRAAVAAAAGCRGAATPPEDRSRSRRSSSRRRCSPSTA